MTNNTNESAFWVVLVLGMACLGFALGAAFFASGQGALPAYASGNRVCIGNYDGFDPCITREMSMEEATRIADAINQAVGREWRGLR